MARKQEQAAVPDEEEAAVPDEALNEALLKARTAGEVLDALSAVVYRKDRKDRKAKRRKKPPKGKGGKGAIPSVEDMSAWRADGTTGAEVATQYAEAIVAYILRGRGRSKGEIALHWITLSLCGKPCQLQKKSTHTCIHCTKYGIFGPK